MRFALAFVVLAEHARVGVENIGAAMAVQLFFVLSGVYMAAVYTTRYSRLRHGMRLFYLNRWLRLWPTYLLIFMVTWLAWITVGSKVTEDLGVFTLFREPLTTQRLLYVVPANLLLFGQDALSIHEPTHLLLPVRQSWSIGTELLFYVFVPFVFGRRFSLLAAPVLVVAGFALKFYLLKLDWRVAYFFPLANMSYFLLGCFIYHAAETSAISRLRERLGMAAQVLAPIAFLGIAFSTEANCFETWRFASHFAFLVAFSVIVMLAFSDKGHRIDTYLGNISYGIYLNHFLLAVLVSSFWPMPQPYHLIAVLVASLALSMLTERILQHPIDIYRRRLTREAAAT